MGVSRRPWCFFFSPSYARPYGVEEKTGVRPPFRVQILVAVRVLVRVLVHVQVHVQVRVQVLNQALRVLVIVHAQIYVARRDVMLVGCPVLRLF